MAKEKAKKQDRALICAHTTENYKVYVVEACTTEDDFTLTSSDGAHTIGIHWTVLPRKQAVKLNTPSGEASITEGTSSIINEEDDIFVPKAAPVHNKHAALAHAHAFMAGLPKHLHNKVAVRVRPCTLNYSYDIYKDDAEDAIEVHESDEPE